MWFEQVVIQEGLEMPMKLESCKLINVLYIVDKIIIGQAMQFWNTTYYSITVFMCCLKK